jgi:hypothetical protein
LIKSQISAIGLIYSIESGIITVHRILGLCREVDVSKGQTPKTPTVTFNGATYACDGDCDYGWNKKNATVSFRYTSHAYHKSQDLFVFSCAKNTDCNFVRIMIRENKIPG